MILKFENKVIFKIGADCGGNSLINEIGFINSHNRNSGWHSIPIGVVERVTKFHSNMVKSIYSSAQKKLLE